MLQQAGKVTKQLLFDLIRDCITSGSTPDQWRSALIFPIPKPHEWELQLINTRPITLLETARKVTVKILTNRIANIFSTHKVLTGGNYAGLPGSTCITPIKILESIISDAKIYKKPLWILSQDISKAYDSVNLYMLDKAFDRLHLPPLFKQFIWSLFKNRKNSIITPFGLTPQYEVLVGIDQGEVISPLIWTIYFDPFLTELNEIATAPYITYEKNSYKFCAKNVQFFICTFSVWLSHTKSVQKRCQKMKPGKLYIYNTTNK